MYIEVTHRILSKIRKKNQNHNEISIQTHWDDCNQEIGKYQGRDVNANNNVMYIAAFIHNGCILKLIFQKVNRLNVHQ